jgi:hypothetical protein
MLKNSIKKLNPIPVQVGAGAEAAYKLRYVVIPHENDDRFRIRNTGTFPVNFSGTGT